MQNTDYSNFMFNGNSVVSFKNKTARYGGAIHAFTNSRVSFDDFSTITLILVKTLLMEMKVL